MQDTQWLQDWWPASRSVSTRSMPPGNHERAAIASAANRFAVAVSKLAEEIEDDQEDPKETAQAIAKTAAILDSYLRVRPEPNQQATDGQAAAAVASVRVERRIRSDLGYRPSVTPRGDVPEPPRPTSLRPAEYHAEPVLSATDTNGNVRSYRPIT